MRYPSARKAVRVAPKGGVSASTTIVVDASLFIVALGENIFFCYVNYTTLELEWVEMTRGWAGARQKIKSCIIISKTGSKFVAED